MYFVTCRLNRRARRIQTYELRSVKYNSQTGIILLWYSVSVSVSMLLKGYSVCCNARGDVMPAAVAVAGGGGGEGGQAEEEEE